MSGGAKDAEAAATPSMAAGESLPPKAGSGIISTGMLAASFILIPLALITALEPKTKPELWLKDHLLLKDPLAAPMLAVLFHVFVLQWLAMRVNAARRKYQVPWPTLYADKQQPHAIEYNCVQRAHQHVLEQTPTLFALLAVASFEFPLTAGVASSFFSFSKIIGNVFGYGSGKSSRKNLGAFGYLGLITLLGLSGSVAVHKAGYEDAFANGIDASLSFANSTVKAAVPMAMQAKAAMAPYATGALAAVSTYAQQATEAVSPYATQAMNAVSPYARQAMEAVSPYASQAMDVVSPYATQAIEVVSPYASQAMEAVSPYAETAVNATLPYIDAAWSYFESSN